MLLSPCWCILFALLAVPLPPVPTADEEAERLKGDWVAVEAVRDGKPLTKDELAKVAVTFTGPNDGLFTARHVNLGTLFPKDAEVPCEGLGYVVAPDKSPRQIYLQRQYGYYTIGYPGIYELKGDTLKLCLHLEPWFSPDGPPRKAMTKDFTAPKGSGRTFVTLQRAKK